MNVVDSSGWLEFFADGPNAEHFAPPIQKVDELLVPSIAIYEVFKRVLIERGEDDALTAVAAMQQGRLIELDAPLALHAARPSFELKLPLADSVILASGRAYGATVWTQDSDFEDLPGVKYFPKQ